MGTMFYDGMTKEMAVASIVKGAIKHSVVGNIVYYAAKSSADPEITFVGVAKLTKDGNSFGIKHMSEDMGPYYFDCPESILKLSTLNTAYAIEWRQKCRDVRAAKAAAKTFASTLKAGDTFLWDGKEVTFIRQYKGGKVVGSLNGTPYAFKISQIKAKPVVCSDEI